MGHKQVQKEFICKKCGEETLNLYGDFDLKIPTRYCWSCIEEMREEEKDE